MNEKIDNNNPREEDDSILYELLEYFVRKQEPELVKCKNDAAILPTTGTIKNALRYLNNGYSLPESISQQISLTLPWKFAVGDNGRLLAILQENVIEIRKSKDEYSSVVGKVCVPKDAFPQWRKIAWSPDASILVLASSSGYLWFYSSLGNNIFNISPKTISQNPDILEAGDAVASLMFSEPTRDSQKWTYEFILVTYSGLLKSYHLYGTHSFSHNYEFSYGSFYRNGVNAFAFDRKHQLYLVAGNCMTKNLNSPASDNGLTCWRPLNDSPYHKLSGTFEENSSKQSKFSIWNYIPKLKAVVPEPVIFRTSISPSSDHLVCLHTDGSISLWSLPNLRLLKKWKLTEQPDHDARNPLGLPRFKKFPPGLTEFHPMDIGWWSENAIIVARYSGSISVCSIKDLRNLLGASPEFLSGQPQISELFPGFGFLCLDCETFITSKKRTRERSTEGHISEASSESEKDDDEVEPVTIVNYTTNLVQSALYSITDIERFQPKRKKSKILQRTYRILGLKSTTPEELYSRKIDIEEYEDALALANTYNLDTDLVYQTRWRKSQFSLDDIKEHLSKVSKRYWVLNECVMRVPETLEAARELLNFGLRGANLETLLAIGEKDDGKFVADETEDLDFDELDRVDQNLRQIQRVNNIIEKIDLRRSSVAQKDLIKYRRKLLDHLDKLQTYEIILRDNQKYKKDFYEEFREKTAVENAVRFAKDGNCEGVEIMFTYHGHKLMPHWLAIVNCFPETLNPTKYEKLLPECDSDGQLFLLFQRELRPKDWSEKNEFKEIIDPCTIDGSQFLYDADPSLSSFRNTELTQDLLQKWYTTRAYQIERDSCIIDNALQLIRIGKSHNVNNLEGLLIELETLDDLVYKIYLENMSLAQLEKLSVLEKVKLLMSASTEKNFIANIRDRVLPFIHRKQKYLGGNVDKHILIDYLITLSKTDLTLPARFFDSLRHPENAKILDMLTEDDVVSLALDCVYSCVEPDMHDKAREVFEAIPKSRSSEEFHESSAKIEDLSRELEALKVIDKYDVKTTLRFIRDNKSKTDEVKFILNEMARSLNRMTPAPDENTWAELLNDMLEIHETIFTCIDIEICFEICVSARLHSGIKINIQNSANLIETKRSDQSLLKVSYATAVNLILDASREYFNSSKSLVDSNMELAKACLRLITDDNPAIRDEFELINSLQILNEFNMNILPLQVRSCQDKLKLIENCLENREDAYKRQQRLLTLADYLRVEGNNKRTRDAKVLELIGEKAYEVEDYEDCSGICQQFMSWDYHPAWRIIRKIGFSDAYQDFRFQRKCLRFSMCYGPNDILEESLKRVHLLEIQILNEKLELWMIAATGNLDEDDFQDADDSDDDFTDAMTTPQVEFKEFVPKIFETSTGLVKSSAEIVKRSTIGILKNVGNTSFWSPALKMNANIPDQQDSEEYEDEDSRLRRSREDFPSFPCFYENVDENRRVSNIDMKYTSYSMPHERNYKLKIRQSLLRLATLGETASYGLEVSDISHFFLQSAENVMSEDCLLGLSYLLSLEASKIPATLRVFQDLPNTKLNHQIAAYYYALEFYRETHSEPMKAFAYDPLDLIRVMLYEADKRSEESAIQKALLSCKKYFVATTEAVKLEDLVATESEASNEDKTRITTTLDSYDGTDVKSAENAPVEEETGWDDNWEDFSVSDHSSDEIAVEKVDPIDEPPKNINSEKFVLNEDSGEAERLKIFEESINRIHTKEDYTKMKKTLLLWPAFSEKEFLTVEKHPTIRMLSIAKRLISSNDALNFPVSLIDEYKELLRGTNVPETLLVELLETRDESRTMEEIIYLKLFTNDPSLHEEAITAIKTHKITDLPLPILEELFFKNLTSSFSPHHPIYDKILKGIFVNYDSSEVKDNTEILIGKLIKNKQIPSAVALLNQLDSIPPALATFESCFQLLLRK